MAIRIQPVMLGTDSNWDYDECLPTHSIPKSESQKLFPSGWNPEIQWFPDEEEPGVFVDDIGMFRIQRQGYHWLLLDCGEACFVGSLSACMKHAESSLLEG